MTYSNTNTTHRRWLHSLFLRDKTPEKAWPMIAQFMIGEPMTHEAFGAAANRAWQNEEAMRAAESDDYAKRNPFLT
jgi:hypothetical protein